MDKEDIIKLAREAGLSHFYDSEGHCTGITDARLIAENKERNDDRLVEMLAPFAALVAAAERQKSLRLWMLLDDIDTADDIAKSDDRLYRSICQKYQKKRWEILSEEEVDAAIRARGQG